MLARQRTGKRDDGLRNASERRPVFEQTGAVSDSGLVCTWADQPYPPSAVPVRETAAHRKRPVLAGGGINGGESWKKAKRICDLNFRMDPGL